MVIYYSLAKAEQRRKELYAKQSRGNQFQTREQRDGWIRKELKGLDKALKQKQEQVSSGPKLSVVYVGHYNCLQKV